MRERALMVGGELTIESRPGAGTTVRLFVPAESVPAEPQRGELAE
jgi:nitrate/nitrite-specific signal transduction histidine kinase